MAVLTLDLSKLPETAKAAALRDLAKHMRGATKAKRVLGRAQGSDADVLADAASPFDGLLLHDARRLPAPPTRFIETWSADAYWRAAPRAESDKSEPPNARRFYLAGTAAVGAITNCAAPINARAIAPALRALSSRSTIGRRKASRRRLRARRAPPISSRRAISNGRRFPACRRRPKENAAFRKSTPTAMNGRTAPAGPSSADRDFHRLQRPKGQGRAALRRRRRDPFRRGQRPSTKRMAIARPSLVERYGSRAYFVATMRVVADKLVKERLLLQRDADDYVAAAKTAPFLGSQTPALGTTSAAIGRARTARRQGSAPPSGG